jgi:redox-sensitive bicupin YhaK (pirin superfamily)
MIKIRFSNERGYSNYDWLDAHYTFSFNTYHASQFKGFSDLLVIQEWLRIMAGVGLKK